MTIEFDELNLVVTIEYEGLPFELATRPPAIDDIGSDESVSAMAGYLIRQHADRVSIRARLNRCRAQLYFEH